MHYHLCANKIKAMSTHRTNLLFNTHDLQIAIFLAAQGTKDSLGTKRDFPTTNNIISFSDIKKPQLFKF